jgi:acyl-CoA thioesterase
VKTTKTSERPSLARILNLQIEQDALTTTIPEEWTQGRTTFGGLVAALGFRAMRTEIPNANPRSLFTQFIAPLSPGPVRVTVEILRRGRSTEQVEARIWQSNVLASIVLGTFGAARQSEAIVRAEPPPSMVALSEIPRAPFVAGLTPRFTRHFEYAWPLNRLPFAGAVDDATLGGWVRYPEATETDEALLLCLVDAWPAPTLRALRQPAPASSVTWKIDFTSQAKAFEPEAFIRFESSTTTSEEGYATVEAKTWNNQGTLLATSSQLVAIFG